MPAQTGVPSVLTRREHRPENILAATSPKTGMWCKQRENGGMVPISQYVHRSFRGVRSGSVGYIVTAAGRNRSRGLGSPMTGRSSSSERVLGSPDRALWRRRFYLPGLMGSRVAGEPREAWARGPGNRTAGRVLYRAPYRASVRSRWLLRPVVNGARHRSARRAPLRLPARGRAVRRGPQVPECRADPQGCKPALRPPSGLSTVESCLSHCHAPGRTTTPPLHNSPHRSPPAGWGRTPPPARRRSRMPLGS